MKEDSPPFLMVPEFSVDFDLNARYGVEEMALVHGT